MPTEFSLSVRAGVRCLQMLMAVATGTMAVGVYAEPSPVWSMQTSVYTTHYHKNPEHNNHQELLGLQREASDGWLAGGATFKNSFYQRSYYAYAGKHYEWQGTPFYAKLSGGLIRGYKGDYRNKIPFNHFGIAPAIIPSLGLQVKRVDTELVVLGNSALMVTIGYQFH